MPTKRNLLAYDNRSTMVPQAARCAKTSISYSQSITSWYTSFMNRKRCCNATKMRMHRWSSWLQKSMNKLRRSRRWVRAKKTWIKSTRSWKTSTSFWSDQSLNKTKRLHLICCKAQWQVQNHLGSLSPDLLVTSIILTPPTAQDSILIVEVEPPNAAVYLRSTNPTFQALPTSLPNYMQPPCRIRLYAQSKMK